MAWVIQLSEPMSMDVCHERTGHMTTQEMLQDSGKASSRLTSGLFFRARRWKLDHEIAAGAELSANVDRRRRVIELTEERFRHDLADRLEELTSEAEAPHRRMSHVPVRWSAVRTAIPQLRLLAERLRQPEGANPQGIARAFLLIIDGTSPLYAPDEDNGAGLVTVAELALTSLGD